MAALVAVPALVVRGQSALDGFDPDRDGLIRALGVQPDGKILIGGYFTSVLGVARHSIARSNSDAEFICFSLTSYQTLFTTRRRHIDLDPVLDALRSRLSLFQTCSRRINHR